MRKIYETPTIVKTTIRNADVITVSVAVAGADQIAPTDGKFSLSAAKITGYNS